IDKRTPARIARVPINRTANFKDQFGVQSNEMRRRQFVYKFAKHPEPFDKRTNPRKFALREFCATFADKSGKEKTFAGKDAKEKNFEFARKLASPP
ncbi:MAG: hypothetical protein J6K28_08500, partial [Alistipes sp.]|nr:hypothetical protein [Alistipes sp.]